MPSIIDNFASTAQTSGWSNVSNLIGDNTGIATSNTPGGSFKLQVSSLALGLIPSTATIVGLKLIIIAKEVGGDATISLQPFISAGSSDPTGTLTPQQLTTSFSGYIIGAVDDTLGLTDFTPLNFQNLEVVYSKDNGTNTIQIQKSSTGGAPTWQIFYTLPFSNKVYNTSGKFSITSGKVSIT